MTGRWKILAIAGVMALVLGWQSAALAAPPAAFRLDGTRWTYDDGSLAMQGILLKPEGQGPFPAVLISHGLGGNAASFGMNKAREMVKWGLVCMACDYAHAGMPGQKLNPQSSDRANFGASEINLKRAAKCLDILASLPEVDGHKLCAYGHSMGGFVTIGLAAKEPTRLVAAAISGSGIAPRAGFAAPSADEAAKIRTPFIMFHGSIDNTVRPAQSQSLQDILKANSVACERHVFEGINHPVDQQKSAEVYGLMRNWFAKFGLVTAGPPVAAPAPASPGAPEEPRATRGKQRPKGPKSEPAAGGEPEWLREKIEAKRSQYATFHSATIGKDVSYLIYLPAAYEARPADRFPVMYWLHGIGGAQTGVPGIVARLDAAIEAGQAPPLIVVFVNGVRNSFYCDSADGKMPVESVIVKDLIPHIDATYRTRPTRTGRIIEGFSMGGYGAAHLGFKYPELFGAVSIIDGALLDAGTMQTRHADLYQRIFGGSQERFLTEHPGTLAEKNAAALRGKTAVRFAVGAIVQPNQTLHAQLTKLDIPHDYDAFDVGHNHAAIYERLGAKNWEFYRRAVEE